MIGLAEILLFLLPFVLFAAWRLLAPYASRMAVLGALLAALAVAMGGAWLWRKGGMGWRESYVPAVTLPDGRVVPGHAGAVLPPPPPKPYTDP